jgi:Cu2+-exporting ATPase
VTAVSTNAGLGAGPVAGPVAGLGADAAGREAAACDHCGLPVPPLGSGGIEEQTGDGLKKFCCSGCATVFAILHEHGLERFYDVREASRPGDAQAAAVSGHGYAEMDDAAFHAEHVEQDGGGLCRVALRLEGVHCGACVWVVQRLGRVVPGVSESQLNLARATVEVSWDPERVNLSAVARGLDRLGYPAHPVRTGDSDATGSLAAVRRADDRKKLINLAVAGAIAGNSMIVAIALYAGAFEGMEDQFRTLMRVISAGLGVLSVVWPGRVFIRGMVASLRTSTPAMDLPVGIALLIGAAWGVSNVIRGVGEVYFDSISVLVFFLLVGRFIQYRQQRRASDAVELLFTTTPSRAAVVDALNEPDAPSRDVPISAVRQGMVVRVRSGETIPVDGVISRAGGGSSADSGRTGSVDESVLTGESRPRVVCAGDAVAAGTVNVGGVIEIGVTASGTDTRLGKLMELVADASRRRAPLVMFADRVAGVFVVVVLSLAALVAIGWYVGLGGGTSALDAAIEHATALLIVTCPCALGLATPLVYTAVIGAHARRGVLIKGADAFDRLAKPGTMLLDKTGTLTHGGLRVIERATFGAADAGDALVMAGVLEGSSNHPAARAIAASMHDEDVELPDDVAATEIVGRSNGLCGTVTMGGITRRIAVGNAAWLETQRVSIDANANAWAARQAELGHTPVLVGVCAARGDDLGHGAPGRTVGGFALGDRVREEAPALIAELKAEGWTVAMLSGDRVGVARDVAARVGIDECDAMGEHTPESKLAMVEQIGAGSDAPVVMVGDGVNDAAALAAADVGIAVSGGAEASLHAADVYLREPGLGSIASLIRGSRVARSRVRWCLKASLSYNVFAATLAAAGLISPLIAAILMPLSSMTVLAIAVSGGHSVLKDRGAKGGV